MLLIVNKIVNNPRTGFGSDPRHWRPCGRGLILRSRWGSHPRPAAATTNQMARPAFARDSVDAATPRRGPRRHWLWASLLLAGALPVASADPAPDATGPVAIDDRLRGLVADLGYDTEVGERCCRFVADWNLPAWKQRIDEARRLAEGGQVTPAEVAVVQSQVLDELRGRLRGTIQQADGMSDFYHLGKVLETGRSQCVGNSQLLFVIGGAVGLDVRVVDVLLPADGTLGERMFHLGSIVRLADGRVRMVDERWGVDSPSFVFTEHFARHGIYWRLIDDTNPLGLHRQVRPIEPRALNGELLVSIGYSLLKDPGRAAEAMPLFRQALEIDPHSNFARLAVVQQLAKQGDLPAAAALADEAVKLDPERAEAHTSRAKALLLQERLPEAVAAFDRAIELKPESPHTLYHRSLAHRDLGDERRALADLSACLRHDPQHADALLARSELATRRQDLAAAKRDCDAAIEIDPGNAHAYWQRGHLLTLLGRPAEAGRDFEAAVALKTDDADLWFNVAMSRLDQGRTREALDAYTKAVDLAPRHVEALANRACVLLDLGRPADALADCDRALAIDPRHAIALFNRGVSLAHLGRKTEARAAIERSVEADPASRPRAEQALARFGL
jgi:tetratricopeptide (TPR) repeat protein